VAEKTWWPTAVQWTVWAILMSLVMGWLARSRRRPRPTSQQRDLVHPASTLIIGLACLGLFAGLAVVSNVFANKTTTWWTTAAFLAFALMAVVLIADYFLARHHVSDDGMAYRKLTGARRYLRWSDLRAVRYTPVMKWFRLETRSGDVARVSVMLMGLPEFARILLAHSPEEAIEPHTLQLLRSTADGHPPSVWA
jgi:Bacterial PH domain